MHGGTRTNAVTPSQLTHAILNHDGVENMRQSECRHSPPESKNVRQTGRRLCFVVAVFFRSFAAGVEMCSCTATLASTRSSLKMVTKQMMTDDAHDDVVIVGVDKGRRGKQTY